MDQPQRFNAFYVSNYVVLEAPIVMYTNQRGFIICIKEYQINFSHSLLRLRLLLLALLMCRLSCPYVEEIGGGGSCGDGGSMIFDLG